MKGITSFSPPFGAQGIITVENRFDESEVQGFDDLWNTIAQRRAAANLPPAATLMKAHTTIDEVIGIFKNQRLVGCIERLLGGEVELIGFWNRLAAPNK